MHRPRCHQFQVLLIQIFLTNPKVVAGLRKAGWANCFLSWRPHLFREHRRHWDGNFQNIVRYIDPSWLIKKIPMIKIACLMPVNKIDYLRDILFPSQYCCLEDSILDKSGGYFNACKVQIPLIQISNNYLYSYLRKYMLFGNMSRSLSNNSENRLSGTSTSYSTHLPKEV